MLIGKQTWLFQNKPVITAHTAVVGPEEGEGPLSADFDIVFEDTKIGEDSWEKSERAMLLEATELAMKRVNVQPHEVDFYIGGDLMNQIISTTFAVRQLSIPYIGVFGACSTSMESLALASMLIDSGYAKRVMAATCSHHSTAEKQYRYPTEYGQQRPPTSLYTVTGAGAAIVEPKGKGPKVTSATIGKVIDMGLTDPLNMGAAMAPAAVDTIQAHFKDRGIEPDYYDLVVTGDLSEIGFELANKLLQQNKFPVESMNFNDCGLMIFDRENQAVMAGGSGCACSAVVTYGHLLKKLKENQLQKILIVATGALHSPLTFQQGETIPGIAHAVSIENE